MNLINEAVKSGARKKMACDILGLRIRTIQRWEKNSEGDRRNNNSKVPINKLSKEERKQIIDICCSDRFMDKSPNVIVPILAEEGLYFGSESTYYRILREEKLLKYRYNVKLGKKRVKPEVPVANGSNQVWSWDITYLKSFVKGDFFYLYLFLDIWSRKIVGWEIYETESSEYASELMKKISKDNNVKGVILHSDNGSPMKGATMLGTLQSLGVIPSFSRPRMSDDNPFSESLFRTLKYKATYPSNFESIEEARKWVNSFVEWYNFEHRHSKVKFVTPDQRHTGKDIELLKKRKETYQKAKLKNPERWSKKAKNWDWIEEVSLNPINKKQRVENNAA